VYLGIARAAVVALPFRMIAPRLGIARAESPATTVVPTGSGAVARAVAAAAHRPPWRSRCLEQAIAAQAMLRRRGIESTLYLGVAKDPVVAHAWLRVGPVNVTGGEDVERFAVVASFADPGPR
jgi:hypothetical protein